jgi:hypothetical protein
VHVECRGGVHNEAEGTRQPSRHVLGASP